MKLYCGYGKQRSKQMQQLTTEQFLAVNYGFLLIQAQADKDGIAAHITDCTFDEFVDKWTDEELKYKSVFGYDLPTVWDENCETITHFTKDPGEYGITGVENMTYAQWMDGVKREWEAGQQRMGKPV